MKNLKIVLAGLVALAMVGCSNGDKVDDIKPTLERSGTIINGKSGVAKYTGISNSGTITVDGDHYHIGMKADDGDKSNNGTGNKSVTNSGTIDIKNKNSIGMVARDPNNTATNSGTIKVNGKYSFGMFGDGKNSDGVNKDRIINTGNINLEGNDQVGMYVQNGAHAINNGDINLNGSNGVGMWANGDDSVITNNGTITLRGTGTDITGTSSNPSTIPANNELGKDNHGNIGMKATNHGKIVNHGKILFKQDNY